MKYFFLLGNHPELSIAELEARLALGNIHRVLPEMIIADIDQKVEAQAFIRTVGGTIKLGRIIDTVKPESHACYQAGLAELEATPKSGKFNFGISVYGKAPIDARKFGLSYKLALKDADVSCRFVTSRDRTLSSVVVEQNKLVSSGRELVFIGNNKEVFVGVTEAVQPFKELSARDYGRPSRDDRSGMLPPKVAEIMINLAGAGRDEAILDPFCGSGTILTEAMLMGFDHIIGSDISGKAIADSRQNIDWIKKKFDLSTQPELFVQDARQLSRIAKKDSIGAVVAETYLGPQRGRVDFQKASRELSGLYSAVFRELAIILKNGGRAVIALPAFMRNDKPQSLHVETRPLRECRRFFYGRPGQRVWREIIILEK